MQDELHVMFDLETLGTGDGAAIVQIGAVGFAPRWEHYPEGMMGSPDGGTFRAAIDFGDSEIGVLDAPTVHWWMGQSRDARRRMFGAQEREYLADALLRFTRWAEDWNVPIVGAWSHTAFDWQLLRQAYERCGLQMPFSRKHNRDYGTLKRVGEILGVEEPPFVGVKHDALDDACHQAAHANNILRKLHGFFS